MKKMVAVGGQTCRQTHLFARFFGGKLSSKTLSIPAF
jgi:ethanolamine utilization protein EutP (predicted NTPase)